MTIKQFVQKVIVISISTLLFSTLVVGLIYWTIWLYNLVSNLFN